MFFAVNTSSVDVPTRNAGAGGGGKDRPIPMLGSTAGGGCRSSLTRAQGQVRECLFHTHPVVVIESVSGSTCAAPRVRRSPTAAASTSALRGAAVPLSSPGAAQRDERQRAWCLNVDRRKLCIKEELARDLAERQRIAEAQAAERARVDSDIAEVQRREAMAQAKRTRDEQHQLARNAARLARVEAVRKAEAAAVEARDRDVAALKAAERAVDERHQQQPQQ